MNLAQIRKRIARNLGMVSSNNEDILEGRITIAALNDEINRVYLEVIAQRMLMINPDDFTTFASTATYTNRFVVQSVDLANNTLTATQNVFNTTDVNVKIQNESNNTVYTVLSVINSKTVKLSTQPTTMNVGNAGYILNNYVLIDQLENLKEILDVTISHDGTNNRINGKKETVSNFLDKSDNNYTLREQLIYCVSTVENQGKMNRCIRYYPYPVSYKGNIRFTYTKLPYMLLSETDEPMLSQTGIADVLINGVTAWGFKILEKFDIALNYEETTELGVVPKGLTFIIKNYKPNRSEPIKLYSRRYGR